MGPRLLTPNDSRQILARAIGDSAMTGIAFDDQPPQSSSLTDYDRQHLTLYVRLLDAAEEEAEWTEVVRVLFGLDPNRDRERAQRLHDSHLARARWMTE